MNVVVIEIVEIVEVDVQVFVVYFQIGDLFFEFFFVYVVLFVFQMFFGVFGLFFGKMLLFSFKQSLFFEVFLVGIFFFVSGLQFGSFFFVFLNDFFVGKDSKMFLFGIGFGLSESSLLGGKFLFVKFWVNVIVGSVQGVCKMSELRVDDVGWGVLQMLNGFIFCFGRVSVRVIVVSFGRREDIVVKVEDVSGVVYVDSKIIFFVIVYDEFFNNIVCYLVGFRELCESFNEG